MMMPIVIKATGLDHFGDVNEMIINALLIIFHFFPVAVSISTWGQIVPLFFIPVSF